MSKEGFIIELQNTLKKYEGKIVNEVLIGYSSIKQNKDE